MSGLTGPLAVWMALFSCGFLWPSEGAINGDGLHLSFLWLMGAAGIYLWQRWLNGGEAEGPTNRSGSVGERLMSSSGLVTVGVVLFVLGTWLSTWSVFQAAGDRRAALNLAFAWTAIAVCTGLCRILATDERCRRAMVHLIAGLGIGVAAFSIWHSQVYYAQEGSKYLEQRRILDESTDAAAVARVQQEFARQGIPLDGAGREQFEQRLQNSTEPFGPFALANTLAGVLAVTLVLLGGGIVSTWRDGVRSRTQLVLPLLAMAVVTWCLVLTKSRTAWTGAMVGLAVVLLVQGSAGGARSGFLKLLRVVLIIGIPAAVLFTAGILTGVVDWQVVLESPRSLQFRFFYWMGAAGVIGDEPLFGAGPGNFRQLYLAHKPVESSEAILDPHNIYLDAWGFAGLAGVVGVLLLTVGVIRSLRRTHDDSSEPVEPFPRVLLPGLAACLFVHFGWSWLSGSQFTTQDVMLALAVVASGGAVAIVRGLRWNPVAPAAATIALLVHLLGAGGLQITIVGFLLLVLATLSTSSAGATDGGARAAVGGRRLLLKGGLAAMVAAAMLWWGLIPLQSSTVQQSIGQLKLGTRDIRGARQAFELAAEADPLSPMMRQHIVEAASYSVMQQIPSPDSDPVTLSEEELAGIEAACADHIQSDTRAIHGLLTRARIYHQLYRLTHQSDYIESCVQDLRRVIGRDPTDAALRVELAYCEQAAGNTAAAMVSARRALDIEAVNRTWSHTDQYLDEHDLQTVDDILNGESQ